MPPQSEPTQVKPESGATIPQLFTWEEIGTHSGQRSSKQDQWLVINRKVYDISNFYRQHPGGSRVISHFAGQDATDAFTAFHKNEALVKRYLNSLVIGELAPDQPCCEPSKNELLLKDFRALYVTVKKMGLMNSSYLFFTLMFLHIVLLDFAAGIIIIYFGTSWVPFLFSMMIFATAQVSRMKDPEDSIFSHEITPGRCDFAQNSRITVSSWHDFGQEGAVFRVFCVMFHRQVQYGWFQHDLGHISVFQNAKWNRWFHMLVMGLLQGGPASWWNHMHNQHHAKPNCYRKDPDLNMHPHLFSLGKTLSRELGKMKKKFLPYNHQHKYFSVVAPGAIVPFFQLITFYFIYTRKKWLEFVFMLIFYIRISLTYIPLMGFKSFMAYYWLARFLQACWFIWVTQMNHIPMNIDYDKNLDWVSAQLAATCNVKQSWFNDWFTGHLNFQIEHHLFPMMPRHNYWKVAPLVKSLCAKHDLDYQCKSLLTAFADILSCLKDSGDTWLEAYLHA